MAQDTVAPGTEQPDKGLPPGTDDTTSSTPPGEPEPEGQGETPDDDEIEPLISDEEFEQRKNDPAQLRNYLNRNYTEKMQATAPLRRLARALEADPIGTLRAMAQRMGHDLTPTSGGGEEPETPQPGTQAPSDIQSAVNARLTELYGAEVASQLGPILVNVARAIAQQEIAPFKEVGDHVLSTAAASEARATMQQMDAKYPGWRKHERAMQALTIKMPPADDANMLEYTENLYLLASRRAAEGPAARDLAARHAASARASEPRATGVPGGRVTQNPPAKPTFEQAFQAAKRGERFEY
jgi:hypothetical protein